MLKKELSQSDQLFHLIGFIISYTIAVERTVCYFICSSHSKNNSETRESLYDLITEFTFNKKIQTFLKIVKADPKKFNCSEKLKTDIELVRKIRNHVAHDSFSYDDNELKYGFLKQTGKMETYSKDQIEKHWKVCKYVNQEIIKLSGKIGQ